MIKLTFSLLLLLLFLTSCEVVNDEVISCEDPYLIPQGFEHERTSYNIIDSLNNQIITRSYISQGYPAERYTFELVSTEFSDPTKHEFYQYNKCSFDNLTSDLQTMILGEGYISSLDEKSLINNEIFSKNCQQELVDDVGSGIEYANTVKGQVFNVEHCIYTTENSRYSYETYVSIENPRPLGGIIKYIGYEYGIENYRFELGTWDENNL